MKDSRFMKWNNYIKKQKYYKCYMFQMLQLKNYGLQQLVRLEGSMCIQKP